MSGGWVDELPPGERAQWDTFVDHFRRDALEKIGGSAVFATIAPPSDEFDVQFACEIGAAVLLDKPILAIVPAGRTVSGKLRAIADEVVEADIDVEAGRELVAAALKRLIT
jgi:hypothetical protein